VRPSRDEIIEARMLASLALIAEANDRSLVEELNLAVQAYIREQLPLRPERERPTDTVATTNLKVRQPAA
jgi:hypothetical protein